MISGQVKIRHVEKDLTFHAKLVAEIDIMLGQNLEQLEQGSWHTLEAGRELIGRAKALRDVRDTANKILSQILET